jgi:hypothetical protein
MQTFARTFAAKVPDSAEAGILESDGSRTRIYLMYYTRVTGIA